MFEEKIGINGTELASRIVMPPMATESAAGGRVTENLCGYYAAYAKNPKIGLIIMEHAYVDIQGKARPGQVSVSSDKDVQGLQRVAEAVRRASADTRLFAQLNHAGGNTSPAITGMELVAPSGMAFRGGGARELSVPELRRIADRFAEAAVRVKNAGFDGVEIHSAHGYLLNQLYSPLTNRRRDQYGADTVENRVRLHVEVVRKVRDAVGEGFPIALRLGGCDYQEGGSTVEDGAAASRILEKNGVDLLDVSGGLCGFMRPGHREPGYFQDISRAVKGAAGIPVMLTGGVRTLAEAETLLRTGAADLIGIGRALLRNPRW